MNVAFDRAAALSVVTSTLIDAIARDYVSALPISGYAGAGALAHWAPNPNHCHEQVDRWLRLHPDDMPVRGWLADGGDGAQQRFVSHSLVRTAAGQVLDVSLPPPAYDQPFIEHPSAAGDFLALVLGELRMSEIYVSIPYRS
ncbi:hypothetical protein F3J14_28280 [Burkholderia sp. Tr-862]|uniref:hypothetical protein n=1 Tax=Burkholderia sp. Tr-862 TaxID=2608331 RepID=UPI001419D2D4|nr:hypothetical protein [Burkholderia sp. Tr-862]NIF44695.1 hypothetical protein [Burkholderia sp. Tr-862]